MKRLLPLLFLLFVAASPAEVRLFRVASASFADRLFGLAERQCAEFLQLYPESEHLEQVTLVMGQAQFEQDKLAKSRETLERGLAKWPAGRFRDQYLFWLAETLSRAGDYAGAETNYTILTREHGNSDWLGRSWYGMAFAQFKQGKNQLALASLDHLEKLNVVGVLRAESDLLRGETLLAQEKFDEAGAVLQRVIENFPETSAFYQAHFWMGESWARRNEAAKAVDHYQVVTTAYTDRPGRLVTAAWAARAWAGIGWVYWNTGNFNQAADAFGDAASLAVQPGLNRDMMMKHAESMARAGRVEEAVTRFRDFLAAHKDDPQADLAQMSVADLLAGSQRFELALGEYQQLVATHGASPLVGRALYQAGVCAQELGRLADALPFYAEALNRTTDANLAQQALFRLGDVHYGLKQYAEAITAYQRLIGQYATTPYLDRALFQLGHAYWQLRNADGAITAFESLVQQQPDSSLAGHALYQIGVIHAQQKQEKKAREALDKVAKNWPGSDMAGRAMLAVGDSLYREGAFEDALRQYNSIVETMPGTEYAQRAAFNRGWCYDGLQQPDQAWKVFSTFLESNPQSADAAPAQFWMGHFHLGKKDFLKAQEQFQLMAQTYTNSTLAADAFYMAGRTAYARQDFKGAIDLYEALVKNYPKSPWACAARFGQGDALTEQNQFGNALIVFETLIKDYPDCHLVGEAYGRRGDCLFTLNRYEEAVASYRQALDRLSEGPAGLRHQLRFKIGQSLERAGRLDDAFEFYGRVIQESSVAPSADEPPERFWTGKAGLAAAGIKEQQLQWRDAITVYSKLIPLCPDLQALLEERIRRIRTQHGLLLP